MRPELQPTLLITGITSLRKLQMWGACAFFTRTVTVAVRPCAVAVMVASPSDTGRTRPVCVDDRDGRVGGCPVGGAGPVFLVAIERGLREQLMVGFGAGQSYGAGRMAEVRGKSGCGAGIGRLGTFETLRRVPSEACHYTNSSLIGSTPRSTSGIGRPCAPGSSSSREIPKPCKSSPRFRAGLVGRSFGVAPISSDAPDHLSAL